MSAACLKLEPVDFTAQLEAGKDGSKKDFKRRARASGVTGEAVAGLLWMYLQVPEDASKDELEDYAQEIVRRIHADASEAAIAEYIKSLQSEQLCQLPNELAIRVLTRRAVAVVRGADA
jgi:hypothetical protein